MVKTIAVFELFIMLLFVICIVYADNSQDQTTKSTNASIQANVTINGTNSSSLLMEKISGSRDMVKRAIAYARNTSKEEALAAFNDVNGSFVNGEDYLLGDDINMTCIVQPYRKELLGTDRSNVTDVNGVKFVRIQEFIAGYGGGYSFCIYSNPTKNFTYQAKFNYIEPIEGIGYLASGVFIPGVNPEVDKALVSELVARVNQAAELGETEGKEKTSAVLNDMNGSFVKDNNYIFALDYNGTVLSMPYNPESVGKNYLNTTDIYGTPVYHLAIDIAKSGGGLAYFTIYNPESGKDELMLCYILQVGDDWLVGSGIKIWGDI